MNMQITDAAYLRQIELETEMAGVGAANFLSRFNKDVAAERGAGTVPGLRLIKEGIDPLASAISSFVADAYSGRPGPRAAAARMIKDMDPNVVAYLTLRAILTRLMYAYKGSLTSHARFVGLDIEAEARFTAFSEQAPGLWNKVLTSASGASAGEEHVRSVLTYAMGKFDIPWDRWSRTDQISLGIKLLDLTASSTGLIQLGTSHELGITGANKDQYQVVLSASAEDWIKNSVAHGMELHPHYLPMIYLPKPWDGLKGGGYLSNAIKPLPLVRSIRRSQSPGLNKAYLGCVYSAVNAIQETAWRVNDKVLEVMSSLSDTGSEVAGLFPSEDLPLPPRPVDIDTNEEALRKWKWAARDVHTRNFGLRQARSGQVSLIALAKRMASDTIYFPHNLDFRGRMYPVPAGLQPQGSDPVKALLHFAEALPLGPDGADWLAIHGANCFGVDKVSFAERIEFIHSITDHIISVAEDPVENLYWTEADKPWCFLAFCFEWAALKTWEYQEGKDAELFLSRIPIALDGSCNGLQHFSAMLLDRTGGSAVNLTPSDKPQDIYQRVADRAMEKLRAISSTEGGEPEKERWAYAWVQFGIDRKITKRPVMVLPYGGTPRSCLKYVEEAVLARVAGGAEHNMGEELPRAIGFLSSVIWDSIGDVVLAAREAMAWLQKTARVLSKHGLPIEWTTPSGFVAHQAYPNLQKRLIKTKISGSVVRMVTYEDKDELNKAKQASSISPNFVHSLDAAAMAMTVDRLAGQGVRAFAMIHDSYGTHACNTSLLAEELRRVFIEIYETDPLTHLRDELAQRHPELADDLPPLPQKGTLDLTQIMQSKFFFA